MDPPARWRPAAGRGIVQALECCEIRRMKIPVSGSSGARSPLHILAWSAISALLVVASVAAARTLDAGAHGGSAAAEQVAGTASMTASASTTSRNEPARPDGTAASGSAAASGLVFPVERRDLGSVVGWFGDARDGGLRAHLGIDIAAPRGTPVLAPADGVIERVEHTRAGGRVIWLRQNAQDRVFYFAHLDTVLVTRGQQVAAGTRIGAVGISGNAAGTRPHLHLAVHEGRDILDPRYLFSATTRRTAPARSADAERAAGRVLRTRLTGAALRSQPGGGRTLAVLPRLQPVRVLARAGSYYLVDYRGRQGYLAGWTLHAGD
jgi:murein DD-endopeptidase MepM/ murein hydrolase activator NlpD